MPLQTFVIQINPQFLGAQCTQFIFREHSQHGFPQHPVRPRRTQALRRNFLQTAGKSAVAPVNLLFQLVAGHADLVSINYDKVIAAIQVRSIVGLVLADQYPRGACGHPAQHQSRCVQNKPAPALLDDFCISTSWNVRTHVLSHTFPCKGKRQQYMGLPIFVNDGLRVAAIN